MTIGCQIKKAELDRIIAGCLGLHVEASTTNATITPGQTADIKLEAINRCNIPVTLQEVRFPLSGDSTRIDAALPPNELLSKVVSCKLPENTPYSQPYWLRQPGTLGTFAVDDQKLIGLPENPPHLPIEITLQVGGQELRYVVDTRYRTVDPVAGELRQPLVIAPPVFTDFANGVLMFATNQPKSAPVRVTAATGPIKGQLKLSAPDGWHVDPAAVQIDLKGANAEVMAAFTVKPPEQNSEGTLRAIASIDGCEYSFGRVRTPYPHNGVHTLMHAAEVKVVRADIR